MNASKTLQIGLWIFALLVKSFTGDLDLIPSAQGGTLRTIQGNAPTLLNICEEELVNPNPQRLSDHSDIILGYAQELLNQNVITRADLEFFIEELQRGNPVNPIENPDIGGAALAAYERFETLLARNFDSARLISALGTILNHNEGIREEEAAVVSEIDNLTVLVESAETPEEVSRGIRLLKTVPNHQRFRPLLKNLFDRAAGFRPQDDGIGRSEIADAGIEIISLENVIGDEELVRYGISVLRPLSHSFNQKLALRFFTQPGSYRYEDIFLNIIPKLEPTHAIMFFQNRDREFFVAAASDHWIENDRIIKRLGATAGAVQFANWEILYSRPKGLRFVQRVRELVTVRFPKDEIMGTQGILRLFRARPEWFRFSDIFIAVVEAAKDNLDNRSAIHEAVRAGISSDNLTGENRALVEQTVQNFLRRSSVSNQVSAPVQISQAHQIQSESVVIPPKSRMQRILNVFNLFLQKIRTLFSRRAS